MKISVEQMGNVEGKEYTVNSLSSLKEAFNGMIDSWYAEQIEHITQTLKEELLEDDGFKANVIEGYREQLVDEIKDEVIDSFVRDELSGTNFSDISELLSAYDEACEALNTIYNLANDIQNEAYDYV